MMTKKDYSSDIEAVPSRDRLDLVSTHHTTVSPMHNTTGKLYGASIPAGVLKNQNATHLWFESQARARARGAR